MKKTTAALAIVGLLGAGGLAANASAQSTATASVQAIATVIGFVPLSAAGVHDLTFGTVTAGAGVTAGPASVGDFGRFSITGQPGTNVTLSFALPDVLTSAGGSTIDINFGVTDGAVFGVFPGIAGTFNPNSAFLAANPSGNLTVGISGQVAVPAGTISGEYSGTITLTVAY